MPVRTVKPTAQQSGWKTREQMFLLVYLALCLSMLMRTWGDVVGWDVGAFLETLHATQWTSLAPLRTTMANYHPPLVHLLIRSILFVYSGERQIILLLSMSSMVGSVLLLREILKKAGVLWSLRGISFVYVASALPVFVFLSREANIDSVLLFMTLATIRVSMELFWDPFPAQWIKSGRMLALSAFLALLIAAGLLTKFSGLFGAALPPIVAFFRQKKPRMVHALSLAAVAAATGIFLASPLYYFRYHVPEKTFFPVSLEWMWKDELARLRPLRDADPVKFLSHMLRWPEQGIVGVKDEINDSLLHSVWFLTWKRDTFLGEPPFLERTLSDVYAMIFLPLLAAGTLLFFFEPKSSWKSVGWIFLALSTLLVVSLVSYGYSYPIWDWKVLKSKYIAAALLWIAFAGAVVFEFLLSELPDAQKRIGERVVLFLLMAFLVLNYTVPVY